MYKAAHQVELSALVDEVIKNASNLSCVQIQSLWNELSGHVTTEDLRSELDARLNSKLGELPIAENLKSRCSTLTKTECAVIQLLCKGLSNKEIAKTFRRTPRTIESHLTHVFKKTGKKSRTELMSWAISLSDP